MELPSVWVVFNRGTVAHLVKKSEERNADVTAACGRTGWPDVRCSGSTASAFAYCDACKFRVRQLIGDA